MKRDIYHQLLAWKLDSRRKPLVLQGARQVGKTYILQEFGKNEYADVAYFNFEQNIYLSDFFKGKLDPRLIVEKLSVAREKKIRPQDTLIILDEIQEAPEALTSLKYFYEQKDQANFTKVANRLKANYYDGVAQLDKILDYLNKTGRWPVVNFE